MLTIAQALIFLVQNAPAAYQAASDLYSKVKADLSESDQSDIEAALTAAQANDAAATVGADQALDQASET